MVEIPILAAVIGIPNRSYNTGKIMIDIANVIRLAPATPNKMKPMFRFFIK